MIERAGDHTGTAFVEVLQNCVIFNDGAYAQMSDKSTRNEVVLYLEDDKPMIFGNDKDKGIRLDGFTPQIVDLNDGKWSVNDLWVHKERDPIAARSFILAHFEDFPNMPTPLGVYRQFEKSTYDGDMETQIEGIKEKEKYDGLFDLLKGTNTWEVTE
jgi:2-oxoglutarate ferredoxin oxidoreductase subunit beta